MERLLELSGIFEMKPEDLLTFDEKQIFNTYDNSVGINNGTLNHFPAEMKKLYEDKISLLEEKINYLQEKIKGLEGK